MTDPVVEPAAPAPPRFSQTMVLLDVPVVHLTDVLGPVLARVDQEGESEARWRRTLAVRLEEHLEDGPDIVENGVAVLHLKIPTPGPQVQLLLRLKLTGEALERSHPVRFLWLLLGDRDTHRHSGTAAEFARLMGEDPAFAAAAYAATTRAELAAAYDTSLEDEVGFRHHVPPELMPTGRFAGGIRADIARRLPHYISDFTDGLTAKSVATIVFLYFACLAPTVAFGGLLDVMTGGQIGAVETIVATALCGVTYALFSGQPLTILGSTGPIIIFLGILAGMVKLAGVPILPGMACVGLWTSALLLGLALTDRCGWLRYFTRFTDEIFAALISVIFVVEALGSIVGPIAEPSVARDAAYLSTLLALGTFVVAMTLSNMRKGVYLRRSIREFLTDFGPTIAIAIMTVLAVSAHRTDLATLAVPEVFAPTTARAWFVNPMDAPIWWWGASLLPATVATVLVYLDQNITVRLVNAPQNKLVKGGGYHLDLAVVGGLVGVCSVFGLPWCVAATVRSLNHVRSLATVEPVGDPDGPPADQVSSVLENRVTSLMVHVLIGLSLAALGLLREVPMAVLFGLFLFMGVASMRGNQFFERLRLWFVDPKLYPPTHYLRAVPTRTVHIYTAIQAACLGGLWMVKISPARILFPLFIALLVPVRALIARYFRKAELALLDAAEQPDEEMYRESD